MIQLQIFGPDIFRTPLLVKVSNWLYKVIRNRNIFSHL